MRRGGLYLVGHCHLRQAVRVFAVERIRAAEVLADTFSRPAGFDVEAYFRDALGIVRGEQAVVRVVFSPAAAPYVRERLWHPSQEVRELRGGRLELRLTVADTLEARRWLLGFGADVEVLEPAALREALRRKAERVVLALAPWRKPLARAGTVRAHAPRRPGAARALGHGR